jgi:hypothetical protein
VTPQEAIEAAELVETETAYRRQLGREMYQVGYAQAEADMARLWFRAAQAVLGPTHAELEERRWGPGGRERFGDPRPGDFPGRVSAQRQPEPEPEPELEAG